MAQGKYIEYLKYRLHLLQSNGKNGESSGVVRKLKRQIRNLEGAQSE